MRSQVVQRFFLSLFILTLCPLVYAERCVDHESFRMLADFYAVPTHPLDDDPYTYLFASEGNKNSWSRTRAALFSWELQCRRQRQGPVIVPVPQTSMRIKTVFSLLQTALTRENKSQNRSDHQKWQRAVADYFDIFDIKAINPEFSGLPFFSLAQKYFTTVSFQTQTLALHHSLRMLIQRLTPLVLIPRGPKDTSLSLVNIWSLAMEACEQNEKDAVTLLGFLLARDSSIVEYFKYIPVENPLFIKAAGEVPVLTRLLVEMLKEYFHDEHDFFSYEGRLSTKNFKNYYFWSAALAAQEMHKRGHDIKITREIATRFSRLYKQVAYGRRIFNFAKVEFKSKNILIRGLIDLALISQDFYFPIASGFYAGKNILLGALRQKAIFYENGRGFFRRDAIEIMRKTTQGATFGFRSCEKQSVATAIPLEP